MDTRSLPATVVPATHRSERPEQWLIATSAEELTMTGNLIDLLVTRLGSSGVLARIGALIGLSPEQTKAALGAAVPAILASLVGAAQTSRGRDQLAGLTRTQDPGLLDNLAGAFGDGNAPALISKGSGMLGSVLGQGKIDALSAAIGKSAGLNQSSAGSLLGALAPVVVGALGREQRAQGLDAEGLARMLSEQRGQIAAALPAGLAGSLGAAGLLEGVGDRLGQGVSAAGQAGRATATEVARAAGAARTTAAGMARPANRGGGSMARWAVGTVAALAILWMGYHFLFRSEPMREAADKAATTATQVGEAGKSLMVGDVDVGQQVKGVFDDATKALNEVTDSASAKAAASKLSGLDDSLTKLKGLVDQLPAEGKSAVSTMVVAALPNLEALITKVNAIPGAGDAIKPVTDPILEKLRSMKA
jgi:hypothetical protein